MPAKNGEEVDLSKFGLAASADVPLSSGYSTDLGTMYVGKVEAFLESDAARDMKGKIQLIFTSPPFPLNRKKRYGNLNGDEYLDWFRDLAPRLAALLRPKGSVVMELGNGWEAGKPVQSTLPMKALLAFLDAGGLNLCQQFVCHNPARLPSPAQWVNIKRVRVKDAFTHVWWMSPDEQPFANNKRVLVPYSQAMVDLIKRGSYNAGPRPSGHVLSKDSFTRDNGGAIPSNVLSFANTAATDPYRRFCAANGLPAHPATMPPGLVQFFVKMLTNKNHLVLDPFAGSNTTGSVAEQLGRRWLSVEADPVYVAGSRGRFPELLTPGSGESYQSPLTESASAIVPGEL